MYSVKSVSGTAEPGTNGAYQKLNRLLIVITATNYQISEAFNSLTVNIELWAEDTEMNGSGLTQSETFAIYLQFAMTG
jgi:hypothetical protein